MIGPAGSRAEGGWNGFNILHTAASRVAALDLGFVPGEGGRDVAGIVDGAQKGEIDFIYLLGADEFDVAQLGRAFIVYQGSHGDAGAHHADVVLPGAAYTEKDGTLRQFRRPGAAAERAAFPPGEAKEDWAILRALSDVLSEKLPYDDRAQLLKAIVGRCAAFRRSRQGPGMPIGRDLGRHRRRRAAAKDAVRSATAITDYYLTNPIARASVTMARMSREFVRGQQDGGGIGMA